LNIFITLSFKYHGGLKFGEKIANHSRKTVFLKPYIAN